MLTEVKDLETMPVPYRDMTFEELNATGAAWRHLSEETQDLLSRYIAKAMLINGVTDRRARVAVLKALDDLRYND